MSRILEVLICTHDRCGLLSRTLEFLELCKQPEGWSIRVVVVANACRDDTPRVLESFRNRWSASSWLRLRWFEEPRPGKSWALNLAVPLLEGNVVALVDDDHRVDPGYLQAIATMMDKCKDATMICGRILPDWDGSEPTWVHDLSQFGVYPLPVPRYDLGSRPTPIGLEGPLPGGGNLALRRGVFTRVGAFSTELGPHGHDLRGGEDSDFVQRALFAGERLAYAPAMVQYHFVDLKRLTLRYLMRKAYQRSWAVTQVRGDATGPLPHYLLRKLAGHVFHASTSLYWPETRFYLVRCAATLGEIDAYRAARSSNLKNHDDRTP